MGKPREEAEELFEDYLKFLGRWNRSRRPCIKGDRMGYFSGTCCENHERLRAEYSELVERARHIDPEHGSLLSPFWWEQQGISHCKGFG